MIISLVLHTKKKGMKSEDFALIEEVHEKEPLYRYIKWLFLMHTFKVQLCQYCGSPFSSQEIICQVNPGPGFSGEYKLQSLFRLDLG